MYKPKRDMRSGGGFGNKKFGARSGAARRVHSKGEESYKEAFDAVCSECGKDCRVPFKPTGKKPVLCTRCFRQDDAPRGGGFGEKKRFGNDRFGGDRFDRRPSRDSRGSEDQLRAINAKLDEILRELRSL